jgi:hypothetical protein
MSAETHNLVHSNNLETPEINKMILHPTETTYKVAVAEVLATGATTEENR